MKRTLTVGVVAKTLGVSTRFTQSIAHDLRRSARGFTEADALKILAAAKLHQLGFTWPVSCEVLNEISNELDYLTGGKDRQLWLLFVEHAKASFRMTALNQKQLGAFLDSVGIALVLPLHTIFDDARSQLNRALRAAA